MTPTCRARTRLATVVSLLALVPAIAAPSASAEEPAPSPEPIVAPDPSPDPAPPRTAPKAKPVVKAAPVTVTRRQPARTPPAATAPTRRRATVAVTAPRRVRHRPPPARVAKRRPVPVTAKPEPTPARSRRELPFASFVPERTVAVSAAPLRPPTDPDGIDLTWPALFVLGGALAAVAAAAASAAVPSFRLALVGGLSDRPRLSRPGHIERRVRRPRHPTPVISELSPPEPPPALAPGTYEIEWFRGYVKSRFFVLLEEDPDGEPRLVESPWFSWRQAEPPPPPLPDFVAARDALLAKLEREGWHECGRGQAWYSQRVTAEDRP